MHRRLKIIKNVYNAHVCTPCFEYFFRETEIDGEKSGREIRRKKKKKIPSFGILHAPGRTTKRTKMYSPRTLHGPIAVIYKKIFRCGFKHLYTHARRVNEKNRLERMKLN